MSFQEITDKIDKLEAQLEFEQSMDCDGLNSNHILEIEEAIDLLYDELIETVKESKIGDAELYKKISDNWKECINSLSDKKEMPY